MTETTGTGDDPFHPCCGSWPEHRYRCGNREWPATATPEVRRQAVRGDCIAPAHAQIEDLDMGGKDYQQRKRLTEILAQVWDDGFACAQQAAAVDRDRLLAAIRNLDGQTSRALFLAGFDAPALADLIAGSAADLGPETAEILEEDAAGCE